MMATLNPGAELSVCGAMILHIDHDMGLGQLWTDPSERGTDAYAADWKSAMTELDRLGNVRHEGDYAAGDMDVIQFAF